MAQKVRNGKVVEVLSFRRGQRARAFFLIFCYLFLIALMVCVLLPLLKVFVDSVDSSAYGMRLWPKKVEWTAYRIILNNESMYRPLFVSVFTTIVGTAVGLLITTMGGYVLAQRKMPGYKLFSRYVLITMLFNGGLIPTYLTVKNLGLMNNLIAVIIPVCVGAYNLILMKSFSQRCRRHCLRRLNWMAVHNWMPLSGLPCRSPNLRWHPLVCLSPFPCGMTICILFYICQRETGKTSR